MFSTPKITPPTPAPSPGQSVSNTGATQAAAAGNAAKLAGGFGSTILTGPQGATQSTSTGGKTLLGG